MMSDNLFMNGRVEQINFTDRTVRIRTPNSNLWFDYVDIIDFKNQVLWAYEKYLRKRKEADEASRLV